MTFRHQTEFSAALREQLNNGAPIELTARFRAVERGGHFVRDTNQHETGRAAADRWLTGLFVEIERAAFRVHQRACREHLALAATIRGRPDPPDRLAVSWRCFHCDEVFTDRASAAAHFGPSIWSDPACTVDASKLRELEAELARYREEDTDLHRALHAKDCKMTRAVQEAEEAGYARGLRDAKRFPAELGLMEAPQAPEPAHEPTP